MLIKMGDTAVSEIIGAVLLLAIAISIFSVVYMNVLSDDGPNPESHVTIVGKLENDDIIFEHRRGEDLGMNTNILLSIGGRDFNMKIGDSALLDGYSKNDGFWNIGERLVYSDFNVTGLEVKSTIIDAESNSQVWWGMLQEGRILNMLGGVWHFDDNAGNVATEAFNGVNGVLKPNGAGIFGPRWDDQIKINGSSSLRFDGFDDYVQVPGNAVSLYAPDEVTVEAWFKFPDNNLLSEYEYGPSFGYQPDIIQISEGVYGIAYKDQGHLGVLKTVRISSDGTIIADIYNHSLDYGDPCYWPRIIHVNDDIYLIAYANSDTNPKHVHLRSVQILENGTTGPVLGFYSFDFKEVYDHELIHIHDNISAIVFRNNQGKGEIRTIEIFNNGTSITNTSINGTFIFDSVKCYEPDIVHISDNIYAIAYRGSIDEGYVKTVEILDNGEINQTAIDGFIFETINESFDPEITRVKGNTYTIAYSDGNDRGLLATVEISDDGAIKKQVNDTLLFDDAYCHIPKITNMFENVYLVVYEADQSDGYVTVVEIDENGSISDTVISTNKFNYGKNAFGYEPDIIRVNDEVYAIAFRCGSQVGTPHEGTLITNKLSDYIKPGVPIFERGVVLKEGVYGIHINSTGVAASIRNVLYSIPISLTTDWHHIAITYDEATLKIYLDGTEILSVNENIGLTHNVNDICFGKKFFGYIDEVAIFPWVLPLADIQEHYSNPATLENK